MADRATTAGEVTSVDDAAVVRAAMEAQRRQLLALRPDGRIGDAAFQRVEQELAWAVLGRVQVIGSEQPHDG